jgi:hypothetical protein
MRSKETILRYAGRSMGLKEPFSASAANRNHRTLPGTYTCFALCIPFTGMRRVPVDARLPNGAPARLENDATNSPLLDHGENENRPGTADALVRQL